LQGFCNYLPVSQTSLRSWTGRTCRDRFKGPAVAIVRLPQGLKSRTEVSKFGLRISSRIRRLWMAETAALPHSLDLMTLNASDL
jgi:hypothetical protein